MSRVSNGLLAVALSVLVLLAESAVADGGLLNGSLGQWLDDVASPQLAEILSRHPKFKGETVRFVPLRNGKPMASGNLLTQAVEQRLTQRLLRREGVRLAWQDDPEICTAPQDVPYLLGLEIQRDGSRNHRLNVGMVDVEEGVWVSGVSLSWKGRLSTAERAALGREAASGVAGSTENPLSVREGTRISEIMRAGLKCSLPDGLDGPLYIKTPAHGELAAITQSLTRAISVTPLAAITVDREGAEWVMELQARPVGTGAQELVLTLQDTTSDKVIQQVASVFVTGMSAPPPYQSASSAPTTVATRPPIVDAPIGSSPGANRPASAPPVLLSPLTVLDARLDGICDSRKARVNSCVEVGFELLQPAYLLVLSTQDQRLRSQACGRSLRMTEPGQRRYRLRIPPSGNAGSQPDAGLYVLALENRSAAHRIARHLNGGPGACPSTAADQSLAVWLREFTELLGQHELEVDWRAVHLNHASHGIVKL